MLSSVLEALSRLPLGNGISLLPAAGIVGYGGGHSGLKRSRRQQRAAFARRNKVRYDKRLAEPCHVIDPVG